MMLHVLLLTVGFVFLVKGADWFVEGAAGIAKKLGIPQLVIGLTIVAMGTSMPEAAVSITSALSGSAGISIGNVVGSNILNILIILGITAVLSEPFRYLHSCRQTLSLFLPVHMLHPGSDTHKMHLIFIQYLYNAISDISTSFPLAFQDLTTLHLR